MSPTESWTYIPPALTVLCSLFPLLPTHFACRLLMQEPDESLDLLRGASLIAAHRHPLLRHADIVDQLDDLAVQVGRVWWCLVVAVGDGCCGLGCAGAPWLLLFDVSGGAGGGGPAGRPGVVQAI